MSEEDLHQAVEGNEDESEIEEMDFLDD